MVVLYTTLEVLKMIKKKYLKAEILCDMLVMLLQNAKISKSQAIQKYDISKITFYKYISSIRNMLIEFGYYEYVLTYKNGYYQLVKYP